MSELLISIGSDAASDSWGFVGVVKVGELEAYRTMEAFVSPATPAAAAQQLVSDLLGELLAGREWRAVRDAKGAVPTRSDFNFRTFGHRRRTSD